jgi:hypothetical protein
LSQVDDPISSYALSFSHFANGGISTLLVSVSVENRGSILGWGCDGCSVFACRRVPTHWRTWPKHDALLRARLPLPSTAEPNHLAALSQ